MAGSQSIVSIELSNLNNCRDTGIYAINPKMVKITGTVFENEPGSSLCKYGIQIYFRPDSSPIQVIRKILIEENKINFCQEYGILIGTLYKHSFVDSLSAIKLLKNKVANNDVGL